MNKQNQLALTMIVFATIVRVFLPGHIANFSPIDAIALFSGAYFSRYFIAILVTLLSVWVGDIFINKMILGHWVLFYSGFYWQYGCYVLITLLGMLLSTHPKPLRILGLCITSSILFFIISNFGVWFAGYFYPMTLAGLIHCYVAAIPFFQQTLLSDLFFSVIMFGCVVACMKHSVMQDFVHNK